MTSTKIIPSAALAIAAGGLLSSPDAQILLQSTLGGSGNQLAVSIVTGDFDGDGKQDLAYGAPGTAGGGLVHVRLATGQTGGVLPSGSGGSFGASLAAGDLDGDGIDELIVGAPSQSSGGMTSNGRVYLFAGQQGPLLFPWPSYATLDGGATSDNFGAAVTIVPDVNSDGIPEIAVGATQPVGASKGYVQTFAGNVGQPGGPTGATTTIAPTGSVTLFGQTLLGGEFNGDGNGDLAVMYRITATGTRGVQFLAGPTFGLTPAQQIDSIAAGSLDVAGDLDGDGVDDVAYCTPTTGELRFRSPKNKQDIGPSFTGVASANTSVDAIGDLNGDGYVDFLWGNEGTLHVRAGGPATPLGVPQALPYSRLGLPMMDPIVNLNSAVRDAAGLDLNGDKVPDWVVGLNNGGDGALHEYAPAVVTDPAGAQSGLGLFSRSIVGAKDTIATVYMNAGASAAGRTYYVYGSLTWLSPSPLTLDDGSQYPLLPDAFWQATVNAPMQFLTNNLGSLNGGGRAIGWSDLPAGTFGPSAVGLKIHYGMLSIDPSTGQTGTATDPAVPQFVEVTG